MNPILILYLVALLMDLSIGGFMFALGRRAAEDGAGPFIVSLLGSTIFGTYAFGPLIAGGWADRFGRRRMATTGCVLMTACALGSAFTTNTAALIALSVVFGFGMSGFWPSVMAWLSDSQQGAGLVRRMVLFSVAWNAGLVIGYFLTGIIFEQAPRAAFFVSSGVIALVGLLLQLPPEHPRPVAVAGERALPAVPAARGFRKTAWLANFAVSFATAGVIAVFPKLATALHIPADQHGLIVALGRGAAVVAFLALDRLTFWRTRLWPLWVAQIAAAGGLLVFAWTDRVWVFAAGLAVAGVVSGYTYLASIYFTLEEVAERGKGSGFHEAIIGLSMFLGPLAAGWAGQLFSLSAPYQLCAAVLVAMVAVQMIVVAIRRKA